jgi:hypothetical protein
VSYATPHDGDSSTKGTVLKFGANVYTVTNIVISNTNPAAAADAQIDVAHLGQTTGEQAARLSRPLVIPAEDGGSGRQITFDYLGKTILLDGAVATVVITIGGTALIGSTSAVPATNYFATVASSTLTLATNDAIRGQGVLSLVRTASLS